jgi:hypothetical protein
MVQLWVNLPATHKEARPDYQTLTHETIPVVELPGKAGRLRVIAGQHAGRRSPARTFKPIELWDLEIHRDGGATLELPAGHTLALAVLRGTVLVNDSDVAGEAELVLLGRHGGAVRLEASNEARVLVLSGAPIDEPVVMQGPFVMNTADEIRQAMVDFREGRFGAIPRQPAAS